MKSKEQKNLIIEDLTAKLGEYSHFYLADISCLNAEDTTNLRQKCYDKEVKLMVVKNALLKKAFNNCNIEDQDLHDVLKDSTSIMFTNTGNSPAKVIKDFRKAHDKPVLKAAYVEESVYIGDEQLEKLVALKSKEELIGDVIGLLQSPLKNVVSQLQSGGNKLSGIVKTLSERSE